MCYDGTATPPVDAPTGVAVRATPLTLTSADGTAFAGFHSAPANTSDGASAIDRVGVVVLPDNRGLAPFYEELTERLAQHGHPAIAIDYFGRTAGTDTRQRGVDFPFMQHLARIDRTRTQEDITAAVTYLRSPDGGRCSAVVTLGFCMGGRNAFLTAAPRFGLAGVIGFYGAPGIVGPYGPGPTEHAAELAAPILGLFGGADEGIPPTAVAAFEQALTAAGVEHDIVTYPGAPHGFFDRRQHDFRDASADAWQRVLDFLAARMRRPAPN